MDKLYSFIERKNRIYVITLISRDKRQIVGYNMMFGKYIKNNLNFGWFSPENNKY